MALEAGQRLSHYRLTEKIGEGGMGVVWKAEDTRLDRTVAIKVLRAEILGGARIRERFEREARTIANLSHPHICTLHDIGRQDETDFIVMAYLEGETLLDRLKKGALPLEQALRHGIEIAEALHEAHRAGMVHRDLKPGNIMLTRQGIKLLDFGLAKMVRPPAVTGVEDATTAAHPLTEVGTLIGTVPYMAPEQLEGKEADTRADIFALGSVLYEMVTGQRAFGGTSQAGLISAIMTSDPQPVSLLQPLAPPLLDRLIHRCLSKHPPDRMDSALDLARELGWIAETVPTRLTRARSRGAPRADYRIEYFKSPDGASIAAARGGSGTPLLVVPTMVDSIETSWAVYAEAFADRELIFYDRRGSGLSERDPNGPEMAATLRAITSREELHGLLEAFMKFDLAACYAEIQTPTLVEHHPGYFFPDTYSRRIASMIRDCRMAIFSGAGGEFITDLSIVRAFLADE